MFWSQTTVSQLTRHVRSWQNVCRKRALKSFHLEWLRERARLLTGEPQPIEFTDRVVAVVRYRDGSVIDVVHQVKE
ncbi:citrate lyase subunit alpha [Escherichia coli]